MGNLKRYFKLLLISFMMLSFFKVSYANNDSNIKRVLILESNQISKTYSKDLVRGIVDVFLEEDINIQYYNEEVGPINEAFLTSNFYDKSEKYIKLKYGGIQFDLVIAVDGRAVSFLEGYGDHLFNKVPILATIKNNVSFGSTRKTKYNGLIRKRLLLPNVEFIKIVQPNIKTIYFPYKSWMEQSTLDRLVKYSKEKYGIKLELIPMSEIKEHDLDKGKPGETALYLLPFEEKDNGQNLKQVDFINYIKELYDGPIYVSDKTYLGKGVLGGVVASSYEDGTIVAHMAVQVLKGKPIMDVGQVIREPEYTIDCSVAKEQGIKVNHLKGMVQFINRPSQFYQLNKRVTITLMIVGASLIFIMFIAIIINKAKSNYIASLLQHSKWYYTELIETMPVGVITIKNDKITFMNQEALNLLRATKIEEITYPLFNSMLMQKLDLYEIAQGKQLIKNEIKALDHQIKEVELRVVVNTSLEGIDTYTLLIEDISYKKKLYESIEKDRVRTQLFTELSHELKTPINLILGTTQLLDTVKEEAHLRKILNKSTKVLMQNSYRLLRLVNNIIDTTKTEIGSMDLKKDNCNIVEVTEEITLSTVDYAKAHGIEMIFDTEEEEIQTAVDVEKYERIILNLISNAIKYNKKDGKIIVYLKQENNHVLIVIEDTGIGISEQKLPYLFDRFTRVNKNRTSNIEGSGLGLNLVKALVIEHGGTIEVTSTENIGTIFTIELPIERVADEGHSRESCNLGIEYAAATKIELSDITIQ